MDKHWGMRRNEERKDRSGSVTHQVCAWEAALEVPYFQAPCPSCPADARWIRDSLPSKALSEFMTHNIGRRSKILGKKFVEVLLLLMVLEATIGPILLQIITNSDKRQQWEDIQMWHKQADFGIKSTLGGREQHGVCHAGQGKLWKKIYSPSRFKNQRRVWSNHSHWKVSQGILERK